MSTVGLTQIHPVVFGFTYRLYSFHKIQAQKYVNGISKRLRNGNEQEVNELWDNLPNKDRLNLHKGPQKAESPLLVQIHTGKIPFRTKVLDIASPVYPCGIGQETLAHVTAYCLHEEVLRVTIRESQPRSGGKGLQQCGGL